jgi:glycine dehydrogenase subunit 1
VSYAPHTPDEIAAMLERIGVSDIEELFRTVPPRLRARAKLELPSAQSEQEVLAHLRELAGRNLSGDRCTSFLGAGAYRHYVPAAVSALASRGEFATAYTPYQAELSQGTLQAVFEFQTLVCQLVGLDVANASLYDGASATAEAALMALRITRRRRLRVSAGLHPHYRSVLETYLHGLGAEIELLPVGADGRTELPGPDDGSAGILLQSPNFLGCIERLEPFAGRARADGALLIGVVAEALSLALLRPPGELGADLACGEAQSFGVPLSYGGPYAGFLAAREKHLRQLPGRLVGETVDAEERRAFVLTLTTREQHIRREKATSNICTNQGLCALRVAIYLALLGRAGLRRLAEANLSLAAYAKRACTAAGLRLPYSAPTFNEFVVEAPDLRAKSARLLEQDVIPGLLLEDLDPAQRDRLLVCTTELNRREQIDRLVRELAR